MSRVFNFSAGPAAMPQAVLEQAQAELLDYQGTGMSVMEMSHRSKTFIQIAEQAEADLRELLVVPNNYRILFLQGGAHTQFSMIPLNLLQGKTSMDYVDTGDWSAKAIKEARKFGDVNVVASSKDKNYTYIPAFESWQTQSDAAYLHYTSNETIRGVEFHWIPETGDVPLVADMSSNILSRPIDIERYGLIYAGAQKNIGPAGLTLVIVREDLLGAAAANTPAMLDYKIFADKGSMYNTPPTYAWYLSGLVFKWLKEQGGVAAMSERNQQKAALIYQAIDDLPSFYQCPTSQDCRSMMNIPFTLADKNLEPTFLAEAAERGLQTLKGHRDVGGMRASIYNAMPVEGCQTLADFMRDFAQRYG